MSVYGPYRTHQDGPEQALFIPWKTGKQEGGYISFLPLTAYKTTELTIQFEQQCPISIKDINRN